MIGRCSAIAMLALCASTLAAQREGTRGTARRGAPPPAKAPPAGQQAPNRAVLERRVQQRLAQVVQQRLGLTDAQMTKLEETNRRFSEKRGVLVDQERDIRMSLRDEMARPDSARQGQVSGLLDRMTKVQHQRADLLDEEQKELGTFMTPLQRANYLALEENIRRRTQQVLEQRLNGRGPAPDGPPPPVPPEPPSRG